MDNKDYIRALLYSYYTSITGTLRVHVPNNWVLRILVIVIIVQVLGKYMTNRYLDP